MARGLGFGLRLLLHSKGRLLVAGAGIAMAVAIMFVELGMMDGVLQSQALIATLVRGDLIAMNRARSNLHKWDDMPGIRLDQIAGIAGVDRVVPIHQSTMGLRNPEDRRIRRIVVFAFPPEEVPLDIGDRLAIGRLLKVAGTVLFDRRSRPIFGRIEAGQVVELDGVPHTVGGFVEIGPDIVNDGAIVMSEGSWLALHPGSQPIMGAIRLQPGADRAEVRRRIIAALPPDVSVLTPEEVRRREIDFTLRSAPIGLLFGVGMLAGLVIGAITCYQVLFNEVTDRLSEFATLKAMGFSDGFLRRAVAEQALLLAAIGFAAGAAVAWLAFGYIAREAFLAMDLSGRLLLPVGLATVAMCLGAGLLAVRQVTRADPAELY